MMGLFERRVASEDDDEDEDGEWREGRRRARDTDALRMPRLIALTPMRSRDEGRARETRRARARDDSSREGD